MDAISNILSPVTASSTLASLTAAASATSASTTASTTTAAQSPEASSSVRTFFSDFARNLLQQQTLDPNLNIDAAVTNNLLSPSVNYSFGGQLYTSAGLLQQYVTNQFLSQLESAQANASGNATTDTATTAGLAFFGNTDNSQTLLNLLGSYEQISLLGSSLSLLDNGLNSFSAQATTSSTTAETTSTKPATTNPVSTNTATTSTAAGSSVNASA